MPVPEFGCTPSAVSEASLNPVQQSTTVIGDAVVVLDAAQVAIAWLSAITLCPHCAQLLGFIGMIWAAYYTFSTSYCFFVDCVQLEGSHKECDLVHTRIFIVLLLSRIWSTNVLNALVILAGSMEFQTSLVPRCNSTISGFVFESHPGSKFWLAMFVARNPPWPSFSPSYWKPQPWPGSVPTKSVFVIFACCNFCQRTARQHPYEYGQNERFPQEHWP